jgi:hypothetical protein
MLIAKDKVVSVIISFLFQLVGQPHMRRAWVVGRWSFVVITRRNHHRPQSGFSIVIVWISLKNRGECRINVGWVKIVVVTMDFHKIKGF